MPGTSGGTAGDGSGTAGDGGGAAEGGGTAGDGAAAGQGGTAGYSVGDLLWHGSVVTRTAPRSAFGGVIVANDGERVYAVESRRDVEPGPFGLPWRSRFRVAAYDGDVLAWSYAAEPDDVISDVVVHPSGDVTMAVLHQAAERDAYDLLRFARAGTLLRTTTLAEPTTIPAVDFGPNDPQPLFRRKSDLADATVGGWVRLLADGENLVATFLSYADAPSTDPRSSKWALGLEAFDWQSNDYSERWARVVEGLHQAQPAAWAYDELRWMEQAIRPFLARDASSGDILVGRAWNTTRCAANVTTFAEFTAEDCALDAVNPVENERLPLAVTRFHAAGERAGTVILAPDEDAAEQVAFALTAQNGELAVAGSVVRTLPNGARRTYPDADGYVDYDGYIATYDAHGARLLVHDFNLGRGDVLAALRVTEQGYVAVGSAGWDRWQGGMSISRGADPVLAWLSADGAQSTTRVIPMSDGSRHYNLHDVTLLERGIVAHGFSDAPMTHSADGGNDAARTFGALRVEVHAP
jgi:hypothetical protein